MGSIVGDELHLSGIIGVAADIGEVLVNLGTGEGKVGVGVDTGGDGTRADTIVGSPDTSGVLEGTAVQRNTCMDSQSCENVDYAVINLPMMTLPAEAPWERYHLIAASVETPVRAPP